MKLFHSLLPLPPFCCPSSQPSSNKPWSVCDITHAHVMRTSRIEFLRGQLANLPPFPLSWLVLWFVAVVLFCPHIFVSPFRAC
jgi:hypothetical protein